MDPLKTTTQTEAKLHFLDYWRIIRIRKTVILAVFLLVVITATIVTFILPEAYSSRSRIKVERDVNDVPGVADHNNMMGGYDPYFIQTEFEIIQSPVILDDVIDHCNLKTKWRTKWGYDRPLTTSEVRAVLERMIDLHPARNTMLIDITVYSDDKQEAADIANSISDVYKEYRRKVRIDLTMSGIKAFEGEMKGEDDKVANQEKEVDRLRKELSVVDTDPQNPANTTQQLGPQNVLQYNALKIEAEMQFVREKTMLDQLKALSADKRKEALPTASPDGMLSELLQKELEAESQLVTLRNDFGDKHPQVERIVKLRDELNMEIDVKVTGIINGLETKVAALKAVVDKCDMELAQAKASGIAMSETNRPYYAAKNELERLKKFRDILNLRVFQEKVEVNMPKTTVVEIIKKAEVSNRPVRPNKPLNIALGIIIGLVVGVGLAFFIEYLDTSVKTIDDVERTLQAPVLGVIPQNVGYLLEEGAESPHAEAYRVLRTNLLFSRKDDKLNTVAVVSAGAGEGKSTTVCNLATVFAQSGQRVLMVDSDLRRPTLHKLMGAGNNLGLTNYLMKQNTLEEVIQHSKLPALDFMSSGKLPSSSLGILSSGQMKELISELKQRYDFVFFDSPPIMGVSDASVLASEVDMTLQVIQYRRYPQPMNIRAKQLIEKVGGNLIGIVLNNINMSQDESYYYYSGYYHDYYSKNDDDAPAAGGAAEAKSPADKNKKS